MLTASLAEAEAAAAKLEGAAAAARKASDAKAAELQALRSRGRAKVSGLRMQAEAEEKVAAEQAKYVELLRARLREVAAESVPEAHAGAVARGLALHEGASRPATAASYALSW